METCFHYGIQNKKGNCEILSQNSDFFFSELYDTVAIACYKVKIVQFRFFFSDLHNIVAFASCKLASMRKKSELFEPLLQLVYAKP